MNAFHLLTFGYAALIRLYPKRFRDEFAEEMQAVFATAVTEAARSGIKSLLVLCLRELWDLPAALLRERLLGTKMGNWVSRRLSPPVRRGAIGFGLGFALIEIISGVLREMRNVPYNFGIDLPLALLLYPLVGGLSGILLCQTVDPKKRTSSFAFFGALGCGLGYLFQTLTPIPAVPIRGALMGGFIGAMMGGVHQGQKGIVRSAVVGALGFGLGRLVGCFVLTSIRFDGNQAPMLTGYADSSILGPIVTGALGSAVTGMIGGAILGAALGGYRAVGDPPHAGGYTRKRIFGLWATVALPMALLAWGVTPALIPRVNLHPTVLYWLIITLGMIWQLVMAVWILRREGGGLDWATLRRRLWLDAPRDPRTGESPGRLGISWRLVLCGFVALLSLGLGTLLTSLGFLLFFRFRLPSIFGFLLWPSYANLTELASPEFAGQWGLIVGALVVWAMGAFFAEEFLFRGVLLPKMSGAFGRWDWVANATFHGFYYLHRPWMIPFRLVNSLAVAWPARRFRSNRLAAIVRVAEIPVLLTVVLLGVTSEVFGPLPTPLILPQIKDHPAPADWQRGAMTTVPTYDPDSSEIWQMDLRSYDVSALDLRASVDDLLHADFDSRTVWPTAGRMPPDFDRERILALGKNPGLGVHELHAQGITGRGVSIAIIDQSLLTEHQEYIDQLQWYETSDGGVSMASMHGAAVASIAVGKTVGVAPEADLYYIGVSGGLEILFPYYHSYAQGIRRILQINEQLPQDQKIRVISISLGWSRQGSGYYDVVAAVEEAKAQGILVVCSSIEKAYGFKFHGLGRFPLADPDAFGAYEPGTWWAKWFYDGDRFSDRLLVPMDSRTTASPTGADEYVFYRQGGWSWAIPYIAGVYALAAQVDPTITPERFWGLAMETGRTIELEHDGKVVSLGPIIDPVTLVDALQND